MGDRFDILDEFGMWRGSIVPAGEGCLNSILMIIVLVIVSTIGLLIFMVIKAIVKGFEAIGRKRWGEALGYFAIPGIPAFLMFALAASTVISWAAEDRAREEYERQAEVTRVALETEVVLTERIAATATASKERSSQATYEAAQSLVENLVRIEKVEYFAEAYVYPFGCWTGEYYKSQIESVRGCKELVVVRYVVANDSSLPVYIEFPGGGDVRPFSSPEKLEGCCASFVNSGLLELLPGDQFDVVQWINDAENCVTVRTTIGVLEPWDDPRSWELCPVELSPP